MKFDQKSIGPDPPAKVERSIAILILVHFHYIVTMQGTVAVQMSKVKNIYI